MVVGIKDASRLIGISIIACCAVFVCTMFLSFNIDIAGIQDIITTGQAKAFYDAQVLTARVVCVISGGCLLATSIVMLMFYIKHYIDTHKKELGILKALGYSNLKIALNFWIFGASVFAGAGVGFCGAYIIMPTFYGLQNEDKVLPEITVHFHPLLLLYLVIVPSIAFSALSVVYGVIKLKRPALALLREDMHTSSAQKKHRESKSAEQSFLLELKKSTLREKKVLVFFIIFASFCFSAMTQMAFSMDELASFMMGAIIMMIGVTLACTTLFIAITTVIKGNTKAIAMMRVFGYSQKQCCNALLGAYRPMGYIGFIIGTLYQYGLLKIMVTVAYKEIDIMPDYSFDFPMMAVSLAAFIIVYELVMHIYSEKIKKVSVKEIMLE